jgi:hypothetical protein
MATILQQVHTSQYPDGKMTYTVQQQMTVVCDDNTTWQFKLLWSAMTLSEDESGIIACHVVMYGGCGRHCFRSLLSDANV